MMRVWSLACCLFGRSLLLHLLTFERGALVGCEPVTRLSLLDPKTVGPPLAGVSEVMALPFCAGIYSVATVGSEATTLSL